SGQEARAPRTVGAIAGAPLAANDRRYDHLRAALGRDAEGRLVATPFPTQDSSMLKTLTRADALILRAPHAPALPEGAPARAGRAGSAH
ncbi:hypothetical protein OFN60_34905, partial [Escherichia coli]|nr:hypothetical protein [Escherichia coli]